MVLEGRITAGELADIIERAGVSARAVAIALGVAESRMSEWRNGPRDKRLRFTHGEVERAVAQVTGTPVAVAFDTRSYTAGLLAGLEDDAQRIMARVREARAALGLGGAMRPDAVSRERESRGDLDAVRPVAETPARRRRGG